MERRVKVYYRDGDSVVGCTPVDAKGRDGDVLRLMPIFSVTATLIDVFATG
jgi:hypothetical protein